MLTFYAVISSGISTRQMQIPDPFKMLRGKSKQSNSLRLTQHCSLALPAPERHLELPNKPDLREITTFATENLSKYFFVKGVCEVMKHCTDPHSRLVPALPSHPAGQMGSALEPLSAGLVLGGQVRLMSASRLLM